MSAALRALSIIWLGFFLHIPVLIAIVLLVVDREPDLPLWLPAVLITSVAVAANIAVQVVGRMGTTTPPDPESAFHAFRARSFLQWAIADAPLLVATLMAFVLGPAWVVLIGAAGTVAALLTARPTVARATRDMRPGPPDEG